MADAPVFGLSAPTEPLRHAAAAALAVVTMDMSEAYITAVQPQLPTAQIVFDRFHVQQ